MLSAVAEELADGSSCKGSVVLHGGGYSGGGADHHGVVQCAGFSQRLHQGSHGRCFLTDGDIDAIDGVSRCVVILLVDDGVDGDGSLSGLSVTDDEFALSSSDGNHGVHAFQTGLEGLCDGLSINHARRLAVQGHEIFFSADGFATVERISQRVNDASQHFLADFNGCDFTGSLHILSFFDAFGRAE